MPAPARVNRSLLVRPHRLTVRNALPKQSGIDTPGPQQAPPPCGPDRQMARPACKQHPAIKMSISPVPSHQFQLASNSLPRPNPAAPITTRLHHSLKLTVLLYDRRSTKPRPVAMLLKLWSEGDLWPLRPVSREWMRDRLHPDPCPHLRPWPPTCHFKSMTHTLTTCWVAERGCWCRSERGSQRGTPEQHSPNASSCSPESRRPCIPWGTVPSTTSATTKTTDRIRSRLVQVRQIDRSTRHCDAAKIRNEAPLADTSGGGHE